MVSLSGVPDRISRSARAAPSRSVIIIEVPVPEPQRRDVPGEEVIRPGGHIDQSCGTGRDCPPLDPCRFVVLPEETIQVLKLFRLHHDDPAASGRAHTGEVRFAPTAGVDQWSGEAALRSRVENGSAATRGEKCTPSP